MTPRIFLVLSLAITFLLAVNASGAKLSVGSDPVEYLNFTEYATYFNYPVEQHEIITEDGYVLTYFRIQAKYSTIKAGLPVVYFQHGLLDSSDDFLINNESLAPGFIMANRGYDCWFGNNRGNKYSLNNTSISSDDPAFWQFTWQHFAWYDQPAAFGYIANYTSQKINYIGHSQGTTQMFAALAMQNQTILDNILSFCALGPVAYLLHDTSEMLRLLADSSFATLVTDMGIDDFFPSDWVTTRFGSVFCTLYDWACKDFLHFFSDYNPTVDNVARMPIFMGHEPSGTSSLNMLHWRQMQLQTSYIFQLYDYGTTGNIAAYGQPIPPSLNLSAIELPVHMFVGVYDELADPQDATQTFQSLTNSVNKTFSTYPYGHMSFLWGLNESYIEEVDQIIISYTKKGYYNPNEFVVTE
jgi:gastric triacylglycerol lipase